MWSVAVVGVVVVKISVALSTFSGLGTTVIGVTSSGAASVVSGPALVSVAAVESDDDPESSDVQAANPSATTQSRAPIRLGIGAG